MYANWGTLGPYFHICFPLHSITVFSSRLTQNTFIAKVEKTFRQLGRHRETKRQMSKHYNLFSSSKFIQNTDFISVQAIREICRYVQSFLSLCPILPYWLNLAILIYISTNIVCNQNILEASFWKIKQWLLAEIL